MSALSFGAPRRHDGCGARHGYRVVAGLAIVPERAAGTAGARRGLAWGAARLVLVVTAIALFTWGMLYVGNQLTMPSITDASAQSGTAATDAGDAAYRRAVSMSKCTTWEMMTTLSNDDGNTLSALADEWRAGAPTLAGLFATSVVSHGLRASQTHLISRTQDTNRGDAGGLVHSGVCAFEEKRHAFRKPLLRDYTRDKPQLKLYSANATELVVLDVETWREEQLERVLQAYGFLEAVPRNGPDRAGASADPHRCRCPEGRW
eukprot:ctg_1404.g420